MPSNKWFAKTFVLQELLMIYSNTLRTFTKSRHFFVSSFRAEEIYNASVSKYSIDGNVLRMKKGITKNPKHQAQWELIFELDGDQLSLKREGMSEVWVRVE